MGRRGRKRLPSEPVELEISGLRADGRGETVASDRPAAVWGALAGETVRADYRARSRKLAELETLEVLKSAPERVEPSCDYVFRCGGCVLQHMDPAAQISFKEQRLREYFAAAECAPPEAWLPPLTGPLRGYRHKARLGVRYVPGKGGVLVGFREKGSSRVADVSLCEILAPMIGSRIGDLRELLGDMDARARIPQIEVAVGDEAGALVFRNLDPLSEADLERLCRFGEQAGLKIFLQPKGPETVFRIWPAADAAGASDDLSYSLPGSDLSMRFHPMNFTQVNPDINRKMIALALDLLRPGPDEHVLDLFCGIGNFTLPLARHAGRVTGVEGSAELARRAAGNAAHNGIGNASFFAADLQSDYSGLPWVQAYDCILLDPPRSGALEIVQGIRQFGASRIVYVACGPEALARDARELQQRGYRLVRAGVMDMFPHTAHVESIALFER